MVHLGRRVFDCIKVSREKKPAIIGPLAWDPCLDRDQCGHSYKDFR